MDEKNLLKVALMCSIIGVFIILILSDKLEPSLIRIDDISESLIEQNVKIQGEIVSIRNTPSVLMFDVKDDSGSIKVVAFNIEGSEFNKGQVVEVFGDVTEYKGMLEIEAKKIESV